MLRDTFIGPKGVSILHLKCLSDGRIASDANPALFTSD